MQPLIEILRKDADGSLSLAAGLALTAVLALWAALEALRAAGRSLLAVGVTGVEGTFASGEIINIGAARLNPRLGDLFARLAALLRDEFGIKADYAFAADLGQLTLEESYQVDFTKFETLVNFPLRHDFESGARELVKRVQGRS